jgi:hypothetical protein
MAQSVVYSGRYPSEGVLSFVTWNCLWMSVGYSWFIAFFAVFCFFINLLPTSILDNGGIEASDC